jgi:hypothetical protein
MTISSETSFVFQQTTCRHVPEDRTLDALININLQEYTERVSTIPNKLHLYSAGGGGEVYSNLVFRTSADPPA